MCTEVCTSQIKTNYWKNRESSIKSMVLNWQPDILFRKEVGFLRKLFLCDLSNFPTILQMPACEKNAVLFLHA